MQDNLPINHDLFGQPIEQDELLRDKFLEPPFTVLDGKTGSWQNRKRQWKTLGIKSEVGRDGVVVINNSFDGEKYGRTSMPEVSIFDPALTELMYRWFCPEGGDILDPFAGGSVRGIVANKLGYKYFGVELRPEQVKSNREQALEILPGDNQPVWIEGDTDDILARPTERRFDMVFSCPPYLDLEVYSDLPADLSNMSTEKFEGKYASIIQKTVNLMKPGSLAVFVVGDVRDKKGYLQCFPDMTKRAFIQAGAPLYNEAVLLDPLGTAMLRANNIFVKGKGKLVKTHQNILVFKKPE